MSPRFDRCSFADIISLRPPFCTAANVLFRPGRQSLQTSIYNNTRRVLAPCRFAAKKAPRTAITVRSKPHLTLFITRPLFSLWETEEMIALWAMTVMLSLSVISLQRAARRPASRVGPYTESEIQSSLPQVWLSVPRIVGYVDDI